MSDNESNVDNKKGGAIIDEDGNRKVLLPKLTKLEEQMLQDSYQRHKDNIVQPQIVMNKPFRGKQSFISSPEKILFDDFEVHQSYTKVVTFTNVSNSFNQFKLKPLSDKITDYFEVNYKPTGDISAGMCTKIKIRFNPQVNEDIYDTFNILARDGDIKIPLICRSKKAIVQPKTVDYIDFGQVIFGENKTQSISFKNHGALRTEAIFKNSKGFDLLTKTDVLSQSARSMKQSTSNSQDNRYQLDKDFENLLKQLTFNKIHMIEGYSELSIPFKYSPSKVGNFHLELLVYFEVYQHSPPIKLVIKGECIEVPIYVEKPNYQFNICLLQHIYRDEILFRNRSKKAMKVQIWQPKETKAFFDFNPVLAYIQAESQLSI